MELGRSGAILTGLCCDAETFQRGLGQRWLMNWELQPQDSQAHISKPRHTAQLVVAVSIRTRVQTHILLRVFTYQTEPRDGFVMDFFLPRSLMQEICPQRPQEQEKQLGAASVGKQLYCHLVTPEQFLFAALSYCRKLRARRSGMEQSPRP